VSEGLKPCIDHVVTFGMGHMYMSQSDKGGLVFGGDLDFYASYASRGNLPTAEHVMEAAMCLLPQIGKARVLRSWGGIMDMTPDVVIRRVALLEGAAAHKPKDLI